MSHAATNWAIKQRGLKPAAKVVLWHLCDRYHPDNGCFPSQETLADDCEMSRSALNSWLSILERGGLISRDARRDPQTHRQERTRYKFPFEDDWIASIQPDTEPCPEDGHGSVSGNQPEPCPDSDESRVRNPDSNLVRESVREPVSARADDPAKAKGPTVDEAWMALGKSWPAFAAQSETRAKAALVAMAPADRKAAVDRVPEFVAFHKQTQGRTRLPYLDTYLSERHRWAALPDGIAAAGTPNEKRFLGAFDRDWWWVFWHLAGRGEIAKLGNLVSLARARVGLKVANAPAPLAEIEAAAKALVQIKVDGDEFKAWSVSLRATGADLPRPDKVEWIWVPAAWPPDESERDAILREANEIMGADQ